MRESIYDTYISMKQHYKLKVVIYTLRHTINFNNDLIKHSASTMFPVSGDHLIVNTDGEAHLDVVFVSEPPHAHGHQVQVVNRWTPQCTDIQ